MSEAVEGSFVFTILSDKNKLFIAKGDNPLCLIHYKQLGLYVYTSTEDIMKNVLKGSFLEKLPFEVTKKLDYKDGLDGLPKSDVLKFIMPNGWFAVRPSGTEPKIKFYFEVFADDAVRIKNALENLIRKILM